MNSRLFHIYSFALFLVLNGCAITPDIAEPITDESHQNWSHRQQQLSMIEHWEIRGRVALFVDDDVYNLGLNWNFDKNQSNLKLEAALGQGLIELEKKDSKVALHTSEGESFFGKDAEQVLFQSTGWSIPVKGLESWIKGINHNSSDYLPDINSEGLAKTLRQDEWQINYLKYAETSLSGYGKLQLPRKIYMKRKNLALKIVIDQWQAPQNTPTSELFPTFKD